MRALASAWLAAVLLAPAAAEPTGPDQPGEAAGPLYLKLVVGAYDPTDRFLEGFHPGASLEGAVGYALGERASLELSVGRYVSSTDQVGRSRLDLTVVPITLRLSVFKRVSGGAVYFGFGLGAYFTHLEGVLPPYAGQASQVASVSDRRLGVNVGAGAEIALVRQLSLVVDVRYDVVSSTFFESGGGYLNGFRLGGGLLFHLERGTAARTGEEPPPRDPLVW